MNAEEDFKAIVIADSISPYGIRMVTFQLHYPRFIHAEFMTHRVFSRNARSSRAVPVKKLLKEKPYLPKFMKNQPGMQSFEELDPREQISARDEWNEAAWFCQATAGELNTLGVHKQWANRMLEWFGFIDVVVSSTDWANFFNLRDHPAAMPEIQLLAQAMRDAMDRSVPILRSDTWHLPYITEEDRESHESGDLLLASTARCARVSYAPFDAEHPDFGKDLELAHKLIGSDPLHASPAEHQAFPDSIKEDAWVDLALHGNLYGWVQFRKTLVGEQVADRGRTIKQCLDYYERYRNAEEQRQGEAEDPSALKGPEDKHGNLQGWDSRL